MHQPTRYRKLFIVHRVLIEIRDIDIHSDDRRNKRQNRPTSTTFGYVYMHKIQSWNPQLKQSTTPHLQDKQCTNV